MTDTDVITSCQFYSSTKRDSQETEKEEIHVDEEQELAVKPTSFGWEFCDIPPK